MTTGLRDGTPAAAGLSARQLDHARDLAASWVKDGSHPALVVLVARNGVVALHEAFGRLGPEPGAPPLPRDALFGLSSVAKPVTATAMMILVEEGRVGLTRHVSDYIPEFRGERKDFVCVHHLLTHTSGLAVPLSSDELMGELASRTARARQDPTLHPVVDALLQLAYERPLRKAPGEEMCYESLNYELLAEIVRRVSGGSFPDFVMDRVFAPLGMVNSHATIPVELAARVVRAVPESPAAAAWDTLVFKFATGSGGGFYSTALDMALFGQAFLSRGDAHAVRILSPATMREMVTNQIPGVPGVLSAPGVIPEERHREASWGYGWGISCHEKWAYFPNHPPGTFNHSGATGVHLWCDPTHNLVGAFFSAATKEIAPERLLWQADLFANAITAAIED